MPVANLLATDRVCAIAHRGGSRLRPENTVAAFDHAATLGVDALECDVHLSSDGEVVVIHDPTLERTTDATGPVSARTADELSRVDAGYHFGPDEGFPFRGRGIGVPRLETLLRLHRSQTFIVELKGEEPDVARRVLDVVREAGAGDRVIIGGFSQHVLSIVRRMAPALPTSATRSEVQAALRRSFFRIAPRRSGYALFQVPFRLRGRQVLTRAFVRTARRAGLPVQAWIVDDADEMRTLIGWGVTGIISDRPDVATRVRTEHSQGLALQVAAHTR
jgi:glycerophosphoryl diester phosphodiesterase